MRQDRADFIGNSDDHVAKERHYLEMMIMTNCRGVMNSHAGTEALRFRRKRVFPLPATRSTRIA